MILVLDKESDGIEPEPSQVFALDNNTNTNLNVISQQNLQYNTRFTILHDETFGIGLGSYDTYSTMATGASGFQYGNMGAGPLRIIDIQKKMNLNVKFKDSTSSITDLNKSALWLWAFDEHGNNIRMSRNFVISYLD